MMLTAAEVDAVRLSLSIALRSVLFSLPLAILVAWLLTRRKLRGRLLLDAFVHLPLVLPPVVVGYLLLLLFGMRGPIGGWLYAHLGIQLVFTSAGAALATAVMSFPLMVRAIRISLEGRRCGSRRCGPHARRGRVGSLLHRDSAVDVAGHSRGRHHCILGGLGEFGAVITFVSNIPGETRTLPLALYTALQTPGGDAVAARLATISFSLGLLGLIAAEFIARRVRRMLGR